MAKFFKYFFATLLGGLVAGILLILILVGVIAGIASMGESDAKIEEKTILHLELNGQISEQAKDNTFDELFNSLNDGPANEGLNQILSNIKKAEMDPNISGILLESGMLNTGYATIEEIRTALLNFKKSGKFIYSYASIYTQKAYYLASVADKIYLTPGGMLEFKGIYSERMFFKNTLEKLGIEVQVFKHGKYKSAVEPFITDKMSDSSREQTTVYVQAIWQQVLKGIAETRNTEPQKLEELANQMPMFSDPQLLIDSKLIDGLKYRDELINELKEKIGIKDSKDISSVSNKKYAKVVVKDPNKKFSRNKIAIIYAEGGIDDSSSEGIKSDKLSKTIRQARRDSTIKAIVLRINSPGGSALGSEIIWREVILAKEVKPVIVSMGDLAASGGYYIACAADTIIAHPTTITGSIGIFGMIPNAKGLFNKIGFSFDGVKTNKFADMPSISRAFTPEESSLLQTYIELGYDKFITRCADGRKTTKANIDSIGQGRVWAGSNAISIGLVDGLGGISQAIEIAKSKAGLDNYRIVELPEIENPFQQLFKGMEGGAKAFVRNSVLGADAKYLETVQQLRTAYPIQARLPYELSIY